MKFRATKTIGYNMLKGCNTHEYPGWHWNTYQKANATLIDQKQDGEINSIFKIELSQDRTQVSYACTSSLSSSSSPSSSPAEMTNARS
jgi:hypothetical protein